VLTISHRTVCQWSQLPCFKIFWTRSLLWPHFRTFFYDYSVIFLQVRSAARWLSLIVLILTMWKTWNWLVTSDRYSSWWVRDTDDVLLMYIVGFDVTNQEESNFASKHWPLKKKKNLFLLNKSKDINFYQRIKWPIFFTQILYIGWSVWFGLIAS
jgi:hypothetical protein